MGPDLILLGALRMAEYRALSMGVEVFLGVFGGMADVKGSVGLGCSSCNSRKVCWVADAGSRDENSKLETARAMSPSVASNSALRIALSSWISGLSI